MSYELAREKIAKIRLDFGIGACHIGGEYADQILNLKYDTGEQMIAVLDKDQTMLPSINNSRLRRIVQE